MTRPVLAAIGLGLLIVGLDVAWFVPGWSELRERRAAIEAAPVRTAERRGADLAHELRNELSALYTHESARPYYEYGNLIHDPRAGNVAWNVTPGPLANEPDDPLVRGYFQVDARGRVTTPTINDEHPELSEQEHLAQNRAFRDAVLHDLARTLAPAHTLVASRSISIQNIDSNSYQQNAAPTSVYEAQQARVAPERAPAADGNVAITVSSLEWRTLSFEGAPGLVAVRDVSTPDGTFVQGFVVDRTALTSRLAIRGGDVVAELRQGDGGLDIAPGWQLVVSPNPRALATAMDESHDMARAFTTRFVFVAALAALAGVLAVMLVARAEKQARERSHFAAAAAHELRTPLAGLQLYGDMLAGGLGDPGKQADYAKRMSEEASRLGRVVSNVLGFSQLERGNLSVSPAVGSLSAALRDLAERAEPALDRAGCALALDVPAELDAKFDRDALVRIVGNLLDNAEKYGRGADDRTIGLHAGAAGEGVEIVVTDRGPGVAQHARPRLFRAFARGVDADGPAGLGLGLALSQSLARAMGGDLVYRPAVGGGAAFVLRLAKA